MSFEIDVENIKCGGCAGSIVSGLRALEGVSSVTVDVEQGRVSVAADDALRPAVSERLRQLGYPEVGSTAGLASVRARAKSFVSCAVGRFSDTSSE
jgi:copper chaperone